MSSKVSQLKLTNTGTSK